ncbi:MAG: uroporphyrinogen decarboxylase family protein [Dehalococcoidia bacterium]|nr:uroporphyrinogen decarboxylase family protein [Dehalococcoidia bacterium]
MIVETMTREERLRATVKLERVDRVPVVPLIGQFALRQHRMSSLPSGAGTSVDWRRILDVFHANYDELGGYDARYVAGVAWPRSSWRVNGPRGGKRVTPGEGGIPKDFSVQWEEREIMTTEDYDTIIDKGWNGFLEQQIPRVTSQSIEQEDAAQKALLKTYLQDVREWNQRGVPVMCGALVISCEMTLSLARTLPRFSMDIHRFPDKVQAALEAMVPDFISNAIADIQESGIPWVNISLERGSGSYFNLKTYERFFFPQLKRIVEALTARGLICVLHMDTNWTLNLPYLKHLPRAMCICELDGTSDIFKAKEILHGHMCIMGDVPASLLSLGTPDEVCEYCEKLVDVVGKDGGFILSSGCEVPIDAKFENVRAMIDTAKNHTAPVSKKDG